MRARHRWPLTSVDRLRIATELYLRAYWRYYMVAACWVMCSMVVLNLPYLTRA